MTEAQISLLAAKLARQVNLQPKLWDVHEIAEYASLSERKVRDLTTRTDWPPGIKVDSSIRYDRAKVIAWFEARAERPRPQRSRYNRPSAS